MIANIASDDALILPHRANPAGLNFRERQTTLRRVRMRGTLAISQRGKAACDEIMHKDAANDDRGPERHLVAESF